MFFPNQKDGRLTQITIPLPVNELVLSYRPHYIWYSIFVSVLGWLLLGGVIARRYVLQYFKQRPSHLM